MGGAQRRVPGGAVLRIVDMPAAQQRIAPFCKTALFAEVCEQPQRQSAEALARVVEAHAGRFGDEMAGTFAVRGEERAQVQPAR